MTWRFPETRPPRKRWLALSAALAVVTLLLVVRPRPRFGAERFEQIREGMTEPEVVALLGSPPGDYRPAIWSNPDWFVSISDPIGILRKERGRSFRELDEMERRDVEEWVQAGKPVPPPPARVRRERWWARGYGINVAFDERGRLIHASLLELGPPRPPPDVLRRVRWWVGW